MLALTIAMVNFKLENILQLKLTPTKWELDGWRVFWKVKGGSSHFGGKVSPAVIIMLAHPTSQERPDADADEEHYADDADVNQQQGWVMGVESSHWGNP